MKKIIIVLFAFAIALSPNLVQANEFKKVKLAESEKYIKTTTIMDAAAMYAYSSSTVNRAESYSEEVTEEEYNSAQTRDLVLQGSSIIETTYKKMTTAIWDIGGAYQYVNLLHWKIMPQIRSFDIIAIGFPGSVKVSGTPSYSQTYCLSSNGSCYTSNSFAPKVESRGGSGLFKLIGESITVCDITLWFNIEKNTTSTITTLYAYGDYSHATTPLSYESAHDYTVNGGGIQIGSSIYNNYDSIQSADVEASVYW